MTSTLADVKHAPRKYATMIVDGNNMAFRYEKPPFTTFTTKAGQRTGIVYGFLTGLMALQREFLDLAVKGGIGQKTIVCWDSKTNLRKSVSADYKQNRDHSKHKHIFEQLELLEDALPKLGLASCLKVEGYEADDLAASCVVPPLPWSPILCVSEDHDWLTLVREDVSVWKPRSKVLVETPLDYSFEVFHALRGDHVDGIKIPSRKLTEGIALGLAKQFRSVSSMYESLERVRPEDDSPVAEELRKNRRMIEQNAELLRPRIVLILDLNVRLQQVGISGGFSSGLAFLNKMEFGKSLQERWRKHVSG